MGKRKPILRERIPERLVLRLDNFLAHMARHELLSVISPEVVSKKPGETTLNLAELALEMDEKNPAKGRIYAFIIMQAIKVRALDSNDSGNLISANVRFNDNKNTEPPSIQIRNNRIQATGDKQVDKDRKILLYTGDIHTLSHSNSLSDLAQGGRNPRRVRTLSDLDDFFRIAIESFKEKFN